MRSVVGQVGCVLLRCEFVPYALDCPPVQTTCQADMLVRLGSGNGIGGVAYRGGGGQQEQLELHDWGSKLRDVTCAR